MVTGVAIPGARSIKRCGYPAARYVSNYPVEMEEKYQLIFNYNDSNQAIAKAVELINQPDFER